MGGSLFKVTGRDVAKHLVHKSTPAFTSSTATQYFAVHVESQLPIIVVEKCVGDLEGDGRTRTTVGHLGAQFVRIVYRIAILWTSPPPAM
jgi:hypothetical protein